MRSNDRVEQNNSSLSAGSCLKGNTPGCYETQPQWSKSGAADAEAFWDSRPIWCLWSGADWKRTGCFCGIFWCCECWHHVTGVWIFMKLRKKGWYFLERGAALETGSSQSKLRGNILCVRRERVSESNEKVFVKGELFVILIYVSDTLMVEWHAVVLPLLHRKLLMARETESCYSHLVFFCLSVRLSVIMLDSACVKV